MSDAFAAHVDKWSILMRSLKGEAGGLRAKCVFGAEKRVVVCLRDHCLGDIRTYTALDENNSVVVKQDGTTLTSDSLYEFVISLFCRLFE